MDDPPQQQDAVVTPGNAQSVDRSYMQDQAEADHILRTSDDQHDVDDHLPRAANQAERGQNLYRADELEARLCLACKTFLCLKTPTTVCCGTALDKGLRSITAVSMCIHGMVSLVHIVELFLSLTVTTIGALNFLCVQPSQHMVNVILIALIVRIGWLICCAFTCRAARSNVNRVYGNRVVTVFFFSALFYAFIESADAIYSNILNADSCESSSTSYSSFGDGPIYVGNNFGNSSEQGNEVSVFDVTFGVIVIAFLLLLQGYCMYTAWGYMVLVNSQTSSSDQNQNSRDSPDNNIEMGEIVDITRLEGRPIEMISVVVGLPQMQHDQRFRRQSLIRNDIDNREINDRDNRFLPSPTLQNNVNYLHFSDEDLVAQAKEGVARGTFIRHANNADKDTVPQAIALAINTSVVAEHNEDESSVESAVQASRSERPTSPHLALSSEENGINPGS